MRDDLYRDRSICFHWNLNTIIEERFKRTGEVHSSNQGDLEMEDDTISTPISIRVYELDAFVAVRCGSSEYNLSFWIGQIINTHESKDRVINSLTVRWYEFYHSSDIYRAKYRPVKSRNQKSNWTDRIHVDSVFVHFSNLTSDKRLPMSVSNHLRSVCAGG